MRQIKTVTKHNLFLRLIKSIIRKVRVKPELVLFDKNLPEKAIYFANHSGAAGPLTLSVYFPKYLVPWGAYPMTTHYFSRWKYLYYIFYRQKLGYNKFKSFILATFFGLISKILYKGVQLIPTYPDVRLRKTIKISIQHLNANNSLLIFPEDSTDGYLDHIDAFHSGIVYLAQSFYKATKEHVPLIPLYYHKKNQQIITGKTIFLSDFPSEMKRDEIAENLRLYLNELAN